MKAQMVGDISFMLDCLRATDGSSTAAEIAQMLLLSEHLGAVHEILERMVTDGAAERVGSTEPRYRRPR
jgi:hypothetical protein